MKGEETSKGECYQKREKSVSERSLISDMLRRPSRKGTENIDYIGQHGCVRHLNKNGLGKTLEEKIGVGLTNDEHLTQCLKNSLEKVGSIRAIH